MVRLKIAGPVYVEYEASPLEYQIEDNLAKIGTALGPAEITDTSPTYVECYRKSVKKVNGLKILLYKKVKVDEEYSPISLSNLLKTLSDDKNNNQMLVLQKKFGDELCLSSYKGNPKFELDGSDKKLLIIERKLTRFSNEYSTKPSTSQLYEAAIKTISKLEK